MFAKRNLEYNIFGSLRRFSTLAVFIAMFFLFIFGPTIGGIFAALFSHTHCSPVYAFISKIQTIPDERMRVSAFKKWAVRLSNCCPKAEQQI
jgi:hypothetical protein